MASMTFSNALLPLAGTDKSEAADAARPGFFARLLEAMMESRRRQASREIARLELVYGFKLRNQDTSSTKVEPSELPFSR